MPRLFLVLVGAGVAVIGLTLYARPQRSEHSRVLRVMTLNAHAGVNSRGRYDLAGLARAIAQAHPDVVGLQEVTRNHAVYQCDDEPARLATLLRQHTNAPWTQVYVNEWVTKHRDCVDSGRGDGVETEGLALLAPEPLMSVDFVRLWNTRIGLAARLASLPDVTIIVTHLASGVQGQSDRVRQIEALLPWTEGRGGARIFIGDFNATPDAPEMQPILRVYHDAWADAAARGPAPDAGATHKGWRIDYVLYTPTASLRLDSAEVIDTSSLLGLGGPEVSDHRPVLASFRIGR